MKKIFLVAAVFIFGSAAYAQTSSSTTRTKFGIKAGVNLPKYKFERDNSSIETESTTNFHVTGYADLGISPFFSIQPGLSLQGKGGKTTSTILGVSTESKQDVLSIDIPVNFVGNIPAGPGNFFIGAGPYVGFNVSGQNKLTIGSSSDTEDLKFGNNSGDDLKSVDFGLNFLGGYQFDTGFNVSAGYGLGLSNLAPGSNPSDNAKINNRILSFSVGYAF